MKLLLALAIVAGVMLPVKADAATGCMLYFTTYNPYSKTPVAGPFASLQECNAAKGSAYSPNGFYSCEVIFVPG